MSTTVSGLDGVHLGVYEKALRWEGDWDRFFASAALAGFTFVDISIDETELRLARLEWDQEERQHVRESARRNHIALGGLCLSVHRKIAPGSHDPSIRARALEVLLKAIDLCRDLGIPVLQLAGYFAYYEEPTAESRDRYIDIIRAGTHYAGRQGVILAIENVDGTDITSISLGLEVVEEVGSPWLQLYPDIGNLAEQRLDAVAELRVGVGHMVALHVKETRPGEPRRVEMGTGTVPWEAAFAELARQKWSGRIMLEMWNDDAPDSASIAATAREFIEGRLRHAGIPIIGAAVPLEKSANA